MMPIIIGIGNALDPRKGEKWPQTIVLLMLIGTLIYLSVVGQEIPAVLKTTLALVIGYFFGQEGEKAEKEDNK